MIKKLMSWLLILTMMCSLCVPVWAVDDSESTDYTSGTEIKYVSTGSESYTVAVPAQLAPGDSGTVILNGTWASNRVVTVSTNDNVQMVNNINENDKIDLDVTFDEIRVAGDNTSNISATSEIAVAEMTGVLFGTWEGAISYSVEVYDRLPLALGVKYLSSGGYCLIDIQNNVHLYDNQDNLLGMIPAMCIEINGMNFTIANTGTEYDGTYRAIEGGNYIVLLNDGEEYLALIKEGCCPHTSSIYENLVSAYYNLYDSEMNKAYLHDITDISELNNLTLRCEICMEEIPMRVFDDSDYIYVYNAYMCPQYYNGEKMLNSEDGGVFRNYNGWYAFPLDTYYGDNLYSEVDGKPVAAAFYVENMILPKTVKYLCGYDYSYFNKYASTNSEITYLGTIDMFKSIYDRYSNTETVVENMQSIVNNEYYNVESFTIHCSDGDLIISNNLN